MRGWNLGGKKRSGCRRREWRRRRPGLGYFGGYGGVAPGDFHLVDVEDKWDQGGEGYGDGPREVPSEVPSKGPWPANGLGLRVRGLGGGRQREDRKSTRLNSSHR